VFRAVAFLYVFLQHLSACINTLRNSLRESGEGNALGTVLECGTVAVMDMLGIRSRDSREWQASLNAAMDEFFHGADPVGSADIALVQDAIYRGFNRILDILRDETLSEQYSRFIWNFITEALQGVLQSCGPNIGSLVVEAVRCSKDASR
jgi:hypothetical protein